MDVSVFDLFSVGIGPSSSHTVGPMRAAYAFIDLIKTNGHLAKTDQIHIELFGSLAMTGEGHATDKAIILGLNGYLPETIDPGKMNAYLSQIRSSKEIYLGGEHKLSFVEERDLIFHKGKRLPFHSNAMKITALDSSSRYLFSEIYYSLGGGFITSHSDQKQEEKQECNSLFPYPFETSRELLRLCRTNGMTITDVMMANETKYRSEKDVKQELLHIWHIMQSCVKRGCETEGVLPGGLNVKRRAPAMYQKLSKMGKNIAADPSLIFDWTSLFAIAVNEENAAGSRIVTSPTNGASGVIPAVLHYYQNFIPDYDEEGVIEFLLVAGAICVLYKKRATLSAAEAGCQGEVGVACSMAAAGLCSVLGGTVHQIENAAEIGMEHHLGLTCDPVAGLVQIPCIERNTMGAIHAITSAKLALMGDGNHSVTLDEVIESMYQTGKDMHPKYKETSEGGLAKFVQKKSLINADTIPYVSNLSPKC